MATKLQMVSSLAEQQVEQVAKGYENWTHFLETAARLYKYSFPEQILIYAQRPDATACASIEIWNSTFSRWVQRGSKGIALIDDTGTRPHLKYVFDVSDTEPGRRNMREPNIWQMREEHAEAVLEQLGKTYGEIEGNVSYAVISAAQQLAEEYWNDNARDIGYAAEGSFLEEFDEFSLSVAFKTALTSSVAYSVLTRCGIDTSDYFESEDFQGIYDFNTPSMVIALGSAVSDLSEQVLREIEMTVKKYERLKAAERSLDNDRNNVFPIRGLSNPQPDSHAVPAGDGISDRQVRSDEEIIPQRPTTHLVQFPTPEREAVSAPDGDRADRIEPRTSTDGNAPAEGSTTRQRDTANGVDNPHEQSSEPSGGNDIGGNPLRIENEIEPPEQGGSSFAEAHLAPVISLSEFDTILRDGGNQKSSSLRIAAYFMKDKSIADSADFLRREFRSGGKGFQFGDSKTSVWWNENGITIGRGITALQAANSRRIPWEQAAVRIRELLNDGQFLPRDLLDTAIENEHHELAERLQFFYRDDLRDFRDVPLEWKAEHGGFPDDVEVLKGLLDNPDSLAAVAARVETDIAALKADPDAPIRHWHDPNQLLQDIRDSRITPLPFATAEIPTPDFMRFITDDEVNAFLTRGSSIEDSKYRILSFFLNEHSAKERANLIRDEYGNSGSSHALSGADDSWYDGMRGKLNLRRGNCDTVELSWSATAERISRLIQSGRYMTPGELDHLPDYERAILANGILTFYYNLPVDMVTPYETTGGFFSAEDRRIVRDLLLEPDKVKEILVSMKQVLDTTDIGDRYYQTRQNAYDNLLSYSNGDYSLFPGIETISPEAVTMAWPVAEEPLQLSFFTEESEFIPGTPHSDLPSVEEQRERIGQSDDLPNEVLDPTETISQDEMDALLIEYAVTSGNAQAIQDQFSLSPRSRESAKLLREIYANAAYATSRIDGESGDMDIIGDGNMGVVFSKGAITESLSWIKLQKRVAELVADGRFAVKEEPAKRLTDEPLYQIGDTVYLDNKAFQITGISQRSGEVELLDPTLFYPIFRAENKATFEWLLTLDDRNKQFIPPITQEDHPSSIPDLVIPRNYRITDNNIGQGGAKTKFNRNIEAIQTLKRIESENRNATPDEQAVLAQYVGCGGMPQAFDSERDGWQREYAVLKDLLTPEEYDMARASTLNAHYTSPIVIQAVYDTVERLGFKTGNVLEPSCGIGNFFGLLPESMAQAKLYGVELDSITGRIAQKLYPKANITISGYEKTAMPDAFFDLAIGNVPFGSYGVADKRYDKNNFNIHDYFFAKTLDQVRPGGIIAFITSKGTLDKQNPEVRKYIAQRAELLGAVRLPNDAFLKNAGTEVTSDIIFLQKRDRLIDIQPDWVHLGNTADDVPVNSYFIEKPEMILGEMAFDTRMYGSKETTCNPIPDADLAQQLRIALANISGAITLDELEDMDGVDDHAIPADPSVRNFSYTVVDNVVYFRENSSMYPVDLPATTLDRIKGMVGIRDCVHELIHLQLEDLGEDLITAQQEKLTRLYDAFSNEFGLLNSTANNRAFAADSAYYLLCSLEIINEDGELQRKADMFSRRTIKQKTVITSVDTASEALAVSISEKAKVDLEFMAQLMGGSHRIPDIVHDLTGVIFKDPQSGSDDWYQGWQTADEYLSGNVREKLADARQAAQSNPEFAVNVEALEKAQPKDLDASEISVRLGSTWVGKDYVQQFMHEILQSSYSLKNIVHVNYFEYTGEWQITSKNRIPYNNILANVTFGTDRMNAYQIIEETLNLRDVRVYDTVYQDGQEKRVVNKKETTLAQQKQEALKQAFKDWIWQDPDRRHDLCQVYNERFNSTRPREYDGNHINFSGISPDITLRSHQKNAIAHILYGGNTLLAHEVGAGKTFEMVAAAMESKRLGICQKSLFAVPNHLTEQWATEFLRLYPAANILVASKKDFEMRNRKKFCAKIATGDYDAVILGHSQLEKIPMSKERQERLLQEQIREVTEGINELKHTRGENFSIKQLEKTKKSLESRLEKLLDGKRKDDVVTFEQLGVDRLYVDEAHYYKNLFLYTKMRNVAGLSQSEAQKSSDLFMKCRYLDELTENKGIIFATGTPISNSMAEMYTMQRYLQYDALAKNNLTQFDAWASTFGETVTAIELAPEGTGYRARTRFARFHNLPELMSMFRDVADIKTADQLDLPRPVANFDTVVVKPTELQTEMVKSLSERAAIVHSGSVDPSSDNMLKITSDGRKIGLDQRLIDPLLPDDPQSKVNVCANNIYSQWHDTQDTKLTQLVFCDFSTPNSDGRFNVYDDIKTKLLEKGVPEAEIAFIHDANTETRKKELFAKVRQGKVRVLIGSTFKMGSGTNVQDRLIMLHDLDCPWRPSDLEQRAGRIVRQGNINPEVYIRRYVTESTFDAYLYQTIENKQKFISQIMSSKSPVRSCEDVDETALSYAEIKALCAGNPLIKEKMDLDIEVARLRLLKADHQSQHHRLEDDLLKRFPQTIESTKSNIVGYEKDLTVLQTNTTESPDVFLPMTILGVTYADKEKAGTAILEACKSVTGKDPIAVGHYRGFDMNMGFDSFNKLYSLTLKGTMSYRIDLGKDVFGNITRINNALADIPQRLASSKSQLENLYAQVENAKIELQKPFSQDTELAEKSKRLVYLDNELSMDSSSNDPIQESEEIAGTQRSIAKSSKPSILDKLRDFKGTPPSGTDKHKTSDLTI